VLRKPSCIILLDRSLGDLDRTTPVRWWRQKRLASSTRRWLCWIPSNTQLLSDPPLVKLASQTGHIYSIVQCMNTHTAVEDTLLFLA
jgi:hypothetical protein